MLTVVSEFQTCDYKVLGLSGDLPNTDFFKYRIKGRIYDEIPVYDFSKSIVIKAKAEESFIGEEVEFI